MRLNGILFQIFLTVILNFPALSQTKLDLGAQSKNVDFSRQPYVRPFPTGATPPATCNIGEMYFQTSSPVGVYECASANTWTMIQGLMTGGDSTEGAALRVKRTSDNILTVGANCSATMPCPFRLGSALYRIVAPVTVTVNSGTGPAYIYIDQNGTLLAGTSSLTITCDGCQTVAAITQYPQFCIPLATWNATDGAWDPVGTDDLAGLSAPPVFNAGSNVTITQAGGSVTIASSGSSDSSGGSGGGGTGDGGSGGGSNGGQTGPYYNPMDPTQWFRDHITAATGYTGGDAWSYTGGCSVSPGVGATGFDKESLLVTNWLSATGAGGKCFFAFPNVGGSYGTGTYDYWSGDMPSQLWVSATYAATDTNGSHYVGLGNGIGYVEDFIGCRQTGAGNWFAVIRAGGVDVVTADTGVAYDANTHRLVVDNAGGTPNVIRCSVDGGTPAVAAGQIPAKPFGWTYEMGAISNGDTTAVAAFQYTIFLQGLPRR